MDQLTLRQLNEILALSKGIKREWIGMTDYLCLDEDDRCPQTRELQACSEYHELEDIVQRLSRDALYELVALCLLGTVDVDEPSFNQLLLHVQEPA